jgi:hypothetical protein
LLKTNVYINYKKQAVLMLSDSEWAEAISAKIWTSPVCTPVDGRRAMEVDWKKKGVLQGYLEELLMGLRALRYKTHAYTKLKQR